MTELAKMDDQGLREYHGRLVWEYKNIQEKKLKLNMSRGIPSLAQLDLSAGMMTCLKEDDYQGVNGVDYRNYGGVEGIVEARQLFAEVMEVEPQEIIIGGNSSLNLMYDLISRAMLLGLPESPAPWSKLAKVKILCPCPGYDRHFSICERLGIEMIPIPYLADGPDMDMIEKLVGEDDTIKAIWCVPKHSNPTGVTYSDAVVARFANMKVKAPDFRILWDNAYTVHHLTKNPPTLANILAACKQAGNPDRVFLFGSTSKITFAGGGISVVAASEANINWLKKQMIIQTIGPDKLQQLRHVRFFKNVAGLQAHMLRHADIIKPKFDLALEILESALGGKNLATWSKPQGGYFISVDTLPGCAHQVVAKTAAAGVSLTPAGASFPYGKDPEDKNIRLAPTFPPLSELKEAMELFVLCIQLVSVEQAMAKRGLE